MKPDLPGLRLRSVCVFCASSTGTAADWSDAAQTLGAEIAARGLRLVYGGSRQGLMGVLADAVLDGGGEAVGILPRGLVVREAAHGRLTQLHIVETMAERKAMMIELADAFVALPGGYGTLDELAEVLTARQLGLHEKPVGLLNASGYYDDLLTFFDRATTAGFIRASSRERLVVAEQGGLLLEALDGALGTVPAA